VHSLGERSASGGGDVPFQNNNLKLREEIREIIKEGLESRDLKIINRFIKKCSKKMDPYVFTKEFKVVQAEYHEKLHAAKPHLEPSYSIIKMALEKVANSNPDSFIELIETPPKHCLTRDELVSNFQDIERKYQRIQNYEPQDKYGEYIHLIQASWNIYESLYYLLGKELDLLNDTGFKKYILSEIEFTEKYKFYRHASAHTKIQNLPRDKIIHLRNYNPNLKKDEKDWEENVQYENLESIFSKLYTFNLAMSSATEFVFSNIAFKKMGMQ